MPPLNTSLIRGCSEWQGRRVAAAAPAAEASGRHRCSFSFHLVTPFCPFFSLPSLFSPDLRYNKQTNKPAKPPGQRESQSAALLSAAVEMCEVLDRGIKEPGLGPTWLHTGPRQQHRAFTTLTEPLLHASLHIIYSARDFFYLVGGVFICSLSCLSHLGVNPQIADLLQNYVAASHCIFHFFFTPLTLPPLAPHVFALACSPPSCKQPGPKAYPSRRCRIWW